MATAQAGFNPRSCKRADGGGTWAAAAPLLVQSDTAAYGAMTCEDEDIGERVTPRGVPHRNTLLQRTAVCLRKRMANHWHKEGREVEVAEHTCVVLVPVTKGCANGGQTRG